jgi:hypothetical protein
MSAEAAVAAALTEAAPGAGIYTFDLFTASFCEVSSRPRYP